MVQGQMANMAGSNRAIHDIKVVIDAPDTCREVAGHVIEKLEGRQGSQEEIERLAVALREYLVGFLDWLQADAVGLDQEHAEMLKFDWVGVEFLRRIGPAGQETADGVGRDARIDWQKYRYSPPSYDRELWRWWWSNGGTPPSFAMDLAAVLWRDHLRPDEPVKTTSDFAPAIAPKFPVVSAVVLRRIVNAFFSKNTKLISIEDETRLVNRREEVLAIVSADLASDQVMVNKFAKSTRTLLGHRLFRFLVRAGVQRHLTGRGHGHRVVVIQGGLSGLATELGIKGSKAATALQPILNGFKCVMLRLPGDRTESLLNWWTEPASPGKRGVLGVALHDALLPDYVNGLPKTTVADREARKLVPIPIAMPPLVGHVRTHSSQALLQLLLVEELNSQAERTYESGYAEIPWARWLEMAEEAGVPREDLSDVYSAWVYGEKAMLKREPPEGDLYALTDLYAVEREVIRKGGEKSAKGRARQAKSKKVAAKKAGTGAHERRSPR